MKTDILMLTFGAVYTFATVAYLYVVSNNLISMIIS